MRWIWKTPRIGAADSELVFKGQEVVLAAG